VNQTILSAKIAEVQPLRFTPAGVPALELTLEHESQLQEASQMRSVKAVIRAVALGALAESISRQPVGSPWLFSGFLASPRNAKYVVFHIQEFQQESNRS